jgi:hypothetical protein
VEKKVVVADTHDRGIGYSGHPYGLCEGIGSGALHLHTFLMLKGQKKEDDCVYSKRIGVSFLDDARIFERGSIGHTKEKGGTEFIGFSHVDRIVCSGFNDSADVTSMGGHIGVVCLGWDHFSTADRRPNQKLRREETDRFPEK